VCNLSLSLASTPWFVLKYGPRPFDGTGSLTSTPCATSYAMQASTRVTGPEPPEGEDALDVRPQQPAGAG